MCGIIGVVGTQINAPDVVVQGLRSLEYRGYDSWGVALRALGETSIQKGIGKLDQSKDQLDALAAAQSTLAIGHTRWATHGGKTVANAHPHQSADGSITIVHNGIIENYQALKSELDTSTLKSETDTEILAHVIENERKKSSSLREAVIGALQKVEGSYAIVVAEEGSDTLIGARSGSPLVLGIGSDQLYLASDVPAFINYTKKAVFLADGQLVEFIDGQYQIYDVSTQSVVDVRPTTISWNAEQAKKGDHPHFMIKEIHEQPTAIRTAISHSKERIDEIVKQLDDAFGVFFVACGSAYHAGLTGTYLFSDIAKTHVNITVASEFPNYEDFLTNKTLLVPISQSGETADTLEAVKSAKKHGSRILAICNVQGSTLVREADDVLLMQAGPEICVLATKSFTSQVSLVSLLAFALANKYDEGRAQLEQAAIAIETFLASEAVAQIEELANLIANQSHLYTIGRSLNYPTALEAALKIKEVSYVHAEGFAGGELKHGPIALIEAGTPVLVFATNDDTLPEILSNAIELKSRGATIVGIAPNNNEIFDHWIQVADLPKMMPLVGAVPAQLLAYNLALERGTDPDKPRNLAKSVTVK